MDKTEPPSQAGVTLSRISSLRGRPPLPQGPRTSRRFSSNSTASRYSKGSTLYSPGPSSPGFAIPKSSGPSNTHILSVISEYPAQPPQVVFSAYESIQAPSNSPASPQLLVKSIPKLPALTPPPRITFDSIPLQWKGLPLEAALWTFSSPDLQEMVSRAIRYSARRSFIRLLSLEDLDHTLPAEAERLAGLKSMTQSKYRFHVHRRTMLLQALNSFSGTQFGKDKDGLVGKFTSQLSETIAECDRHFEELLRIADQQLQIAKLQDVHCASALAIALRKLNKSYGRRTTDLVEARERIEHLEAELEDAWREAEKMAREMDDLGAGVTSDDESEAEIDIAELVAIATSPTTKVNSQDEIIPQVESESPPTSPKDELNTDTSTHAKLVPDTASIRTTRSTRSTRSPIADTRRSSVVEAAKRRSSRTSMGSLRLPNRQSSVNYGKPQDDKPPVPGLPDLPNIFASPPASSFLHFDSRHDSVVGGIELTSRPQTAIDDIQVVARPSPSPLQVTVDDNGDMPRTTITDDTQVVTRTPSTPADDINVLAGKRMFSDDHSLSGQPAIPSIWLHADMPKTPAERVESLMRENADKKSSYHRLKTLTKRYSLPFPLFAAKSPMPRPTSYHSGS